jgi:hypothetical protein
MKYLFSLFIFLFSATTSLAEEIKVEFGPIPDWQKPVMDKVTFGVKMRSLGEILDTKDTKDTPSFLVFTAEATDNLGKRLLWVGAEVEFSNGVVRKFENVSFFLLNKGVEADIKKLDETTLRGFVLPGDKPKQVDDSKPVQITKLKIISAVCK